MLQTLKKEHYLKMYEKPCISVAFEMPSNTYFAYSLEGSGEQGFIEFD